MGRVRRQQYASDCKRQTSHTIASMSHILLGEARLQIYQRPSANRQVHTRFAIKWQVSHFLVYWCNSLSDKQEYQPLPSRRHESCVDSPCAYLRHSQYCPLYGCNPSRRHEDSAAELSCDAAARESHEACAITDVAKKSLERLRLVHHRPFHV